MRFHALAAAIAAIALGACAGRPRSPIFASPTVVSPSPTPRATDPMPPEERPELPPPAERRPARAKDRSEARAKDRPKDQPEARSKDRSKTPKDQDQPEAPVRAVSAAPIREVSAADPPPSRGADRGDRADPPGAATSPKPRTSKTTNVDAPDASGPDTSRRASSARSSNARSSNARDNERDNERDADATDPDAPGSDAKASGSGRERLRAPHRGAEPAPPPARAPADLRALVGRRDARESLAAVAAWSRGLGAPIAATTGAELVSWAAETHRLRPPTEAPRPGDLLVFDQVVSDDPADLVALVLDSDERGVTELLYVGGGVVRRGLVDASRPAVHRDAQGATVNTYLRHGRRWPAKGMHYLAGELLAHVVRMR